MRTLLFTVPAAYDGQPVQNYLRRECGVSWRLLVRLKRTDNGITADGNPVRSIDRLSPGQTIALQIPEDDVRVEPIPMPLAVAYEDEDLLVVDKPPYLAVHPSAGKTDPTLANAVAAYFQSNGQRLSFRPLNRLDRNTSGLLLAGKNAHVAHVLAGRVHKEYLAVVLGNLTGCGVIDQPIRIKDGCCITREVGEGGKESRTHWRAIAGDGTVTLVHLILETGRTHQIRVHMSWLGHPLAGDTMYGHDETEISRHALHCAAMSLLHPVTGLSLRLTAPLPDDMRRLLKSHYLPYDHKSFINDLFFQAPSIV